MRSMLSMFVLLALTACHAGPPVVEVATAQVEMETEQLIRYSLSDRLLQDLENRYRDQIVATITTEEISRSDLIRIVEDELQTLAEKEHKRLLEKLVPIYRRYFTAEEIHQLLSFYQTDVARKSIMVSSQIAAESRDYVRLWNDHFGETLLQGVEARLREIGIELDR